MKLLVIICLLAGISCKAQIIYVDTNAPGTNNGSSWVNAYNYLQDALSIAGSVDEIRVAEGIYRPDRSLGHPNGTKSRTATFQLIDGITIKGSYAGFDKPDPNERDVDEYTTVLSGDVNDNDEPNFVNYDDNSYHIVSFAGTEYSVLLDGFTITAGNSNGSDPYDRGAAVYNNQGTLNFVNCTISYNLAKGNGPGAAGFCSGLYNYKGTVSFTGCTISNNKSIGGDGGGMGGPALYNINGTITLTECTLSDNMAFGGDGGGEAIACISSHTADQWGDSYITLNNCIFSGNQVVAGDGGGQAVGCIYNFGWRNSRAFLTMTGCSFLGNQSIGGTFGGEAVGCITNRASQSSAYGKLTMNNCMFVNNRVEGDIGFAIGVIKNHASYDSTRAYLTMINCFVTDNSITMNEGHSESGFIHNKASFGHSESYAIMINCTVANNNATISTGFIDFSGLYNDDGWSGGKTFFKVQNTIVAGHFDVITGMRYDTYGVFDSNSSYNLIAVVDEESNLDNGIGTFFGEMFSPLDPFFVDPCNGDYHLKSQAGRWQTDSQMWIQDDVTSPSIGAGNPGFDLGDEPMDANNVRLNMGAFGGTAEASKTPPNWSLLADLNNDGIVDFTDLDQFSNKWLNSGEHLYPDLNRSGVIDFSDYALLANDWFKQTSWY
ncbi:MAG: hypothetical protein ACYTBV_08815 [Planctomycetota bacterium]